MGGSYFRIGYGIQGSQRIFTLTFTFFYRPKVFNRNMFFSLSNTIILKAVRVLTRGSQIRF